MIACGKRGLKISQGAPAWRHPGEFQITAELLAALERVTIMKTDKDIIRPYAATIDDGSAYQE